VKRKDVQERSERARRAARKRAREARRARGSFRLLASYVKEVHRRLYNPTPEEKRLDLIIHHTAGLFRALVGDLGLPFVKHREEGEGNRAD